MRLATFNVENMFERAKAMNLENWELGASILEDYKELNDLIHRDIYTEEIKAEILLIMKSHKGLLTQGESTFLRLREIRGKLIARPKNKPPEIAVSGRDDWVGWFELEKETIKGKAIENIGRVIGLLDTDILCIVEAENRISLQHFNLDVLPFVEVNSFEHVMLIDGNDTRGIDVGILVRAPMELLGIYSHIDDMDEKGKIFSRDCAEYLIKTADGNTLLVLINHFKSKGYGGFAESNEKRLRQARRVRQIYEDRLSEGFDYIAVVGDLNAAPHESCMDPLIREGSTLIDIMAHPNFLGDNRPGTHGNGTASAKLDYILMSPKLAAKMENGGIERRGVWGGKNGTLFPHLPTIQTRQDAASDHAALWGKLLV